MPDKFKIATVVLTAILVHDMRVTRRNRKKFQKFLEINQDVLNHYDRQVDYLVHKLNEYEVPFTEFDKLVMHNLIQP